MAEADIPKVQASTLTRETSTLTGLGEKQSKPPIEKVELKGTVVVKKPSFFVKLKETFIADDARDVGDYILWDILVPTIKRTIRDVIVGSTDRIFLGTGSTNSSSSLYRERGVTYVKRTDYSSRSNNQRTRSSIESRSSESSSPSPRVNFGIDNVVFDRYEDAATVLERMVDYLDTYGKVTVDDYFGLAGQSIDYTAQNWGWRSLSSATIINTFGGYFIKLPKPILIKD